MLVRSCIRFRRASTVSRGVCGWALACAWDLVAGKLPNRCYTVSWGPVLVSDLTMYLHRYCGCGIDMATRVAAALSSVT
ncbi:hypothetical protein F5141DRAFT_1080203 [Pisolithus sp. B1]|nr:hypothetical protein F5141DRAFT_1080203 [Pisolithus sp. B1]